MNDAVPALTCAEALHVGGRSSMEFSLRSIPAFGPVLAGSSTLLVSAVWRELRRRARHFGTTTPCYESVRKLVIVERERRARLPAAIRTVLETAMRRIPVLPECIEDLPAAATRAAPGRVFARVRREAAAPGRSGRTSGTREKARAAFRRPSIPVASVGFGRGASCLNPAPITRGMGRRRGMRVPFARLWRFPSGSQGHASTRWYLHCRYCWNLSRPDHLLSAVRPNVYRERGTTASTACRTPSPRPRPFRRPARAPDRCRPGCRQAGSARGPSGCRTARHDAGRRRRSPQSKSPSTSGPSSCEHRSSSANSSPSQL